MLTNVTGAKCGESVELVYPMDKKVRDFLVQAPCENKSNGQWYCTTCHEFFQNNLQKDLHLDEHPKKTHKLAWNCYEHGLEQP